VKQAAEVTSGEPPQSGSRVVLEDVHKIFHRGLFRGRSETHALKGISLQVAPGEVLALLGPNGSGKSTTLKLISTMLLPDQGRILVNGADTRWDGRSVRRHVGFAVASERSFFGRLTARENLEFFAALEDVPREQRPHRVASVLRTVGLEESGGKLAMKLSSGNYQRLAIARALVKRPSVLLLDEPAHSLDAAASAVLWRLVRELASFGTAIIIATHNFEEASAVADRIAVLRQGELLDVRRTGALTSEAMRDYYLEITGGPRHVPWPERVPA